MASSSERSSSMSRPSIVKCTSLPRSCAMSRTSRGNRSNTWATGDMRACNTSSWSDPTKRAASAAARTTARSGVSDCSMARRRRSRVMTNSPTRSRSVSSRRASRRTVRGASATRALPLAGVGVASLTTTRATSPALCAAARMSSSVADDCRVIRKAPSKRSSCKRSWAGSVPRTVPTVDSFARTITARTPLSGQSVVRRTSTCRVVPTAPLGASAVTYGAASIGPLPAVTVGAD